MAGGCELSAQPSVLYTGIQEEARRCPERGRSGCCLGGERVAVRVEWDGRELSLSRAWGASSMELRLAERRLCVCELAAEGTDRDRLDSRKTIVTYPRRHSPPSTQRVQYYYSKLIYLPQPRPCMQQKKMPANQKLLTCKISVCLSLLGAATAVQTILRLLSSRLHIPL